MFPSDGYNQEDLPKEVTVNPTWHFIATSWSKSTNVLTVYIDGKTNTWSRDFKSSFSGGGRLGLRIEGPAFPIRLTSFNMWDHVLGADVIAEQRKSCSGAVGNVKEWYDVWPVVQSKSSYYTQPSTCTAPQTAPESGANADDLQSSRKSLFAKYKKRKSKMEVKSRKGSKTHH